MLIPIVGIRHYIDNTDAFLRSLTPDTLVFLTHEDSNSYDRTAIAAIVDGQKVGYVSSDYTLLIRSNYPDDKDFRTHVRPNDWALEDNAFYIDVLITIIPGLKQEIRGTKKGFNLALHLVLICVALVSFNPWCNMWVCIAPDFFFSLEANPWYYIMGVICLYFAIRGTVKHIKMK